MARFRETKIRKNVRELKILVSGEKNEKHMCKKQFKKLHTRMEELFPNKKPNFYLLNANNVWDNLPKEAKSNGNMSIVTYNGRKKRIIIDLDYVKTRQNQNKKCLAEKQRKTQAVNWATESTFAPAVNYINEDTVSILEANVCTILFWAKKSIEIACFDPSKLSASELTETIVRKILCEGQKFEDENLSEDSFVYFSIKINRACFSKNTFKEALEAVKKECEVYMHQQQRCLKHAC